MSAVDVQKRAARPAALMGSQSITTGAFRLRQSCVASVALTNQGGQAAWAGYVPGADRNRRGPGVHHGECAHDRPEGSRPTVSSSLRRHWAGCYCLESKEAKEGRRRRMATATCSAADYWGKREPPLQQGGQAPGMSADPLINDGHTSILVQLQLLPRGLKPHHFR